jgi:hypothetical protein
LGSLYEVAGATYQWISPWIDEVTPVEGAEEITEWWTAVNGWDTGLIDDQISYPIKLPWAFAYFETLVDTIYVETNGVIFFEGTGILARPVSNGGGWEVGIPHRGGIRDGFLKPYGTDLFPGSGGKVTKLITDEHVVITFERVRFYGEGPQTTVTFQAIINKDGSFKFQYEDLQDDRLLDHQNTPVRTLVGYEDFDGARGEEIASRIVNPLGTGYDSLGPASFSAYSISPVTFAASPGPCIDCIKGSYDHDMNANGSTPCNACAGGACNTWRQLACLCACALASPTLFARRKVYLWDGVSAVCRLRSRFLHR